MKLSRFVAEAVHKTLKGKMYVTDSDVNRHTMLLFMDGSAYHSVRLLRLSQWLMCDGAAMYHAELAQAAGGNSDETSLYAKPEKTMPLVISRGKRLQRRDTYEFEVDCYGVSSPKEVSVFAAFRRDPIFKRLFTRGDIVSLGESDEVNV